MCEQSQYFTVSFNILESIDQEARLEKNLLKDLLDNIYTQMGNRNIYSTIEDENKF